MDKRLAIMDAIYGKCDEQQRLTKSRKGQLEYLTTMHFIHQYAGQNASILEVGAGTGRYSIALAKEGYHVTAVELVGHNLEILRQNSQDIANLVSYQGDALDLSRFADNTFDVTLVLGPMYHLYSAADHHRALNEAIRVTKPGGVILVAFLSIYGIMFTNYLKDNFRLGFEENYTPDYVVRHFEEQGFTAFDITDFENLFAGKRVSHLGTVSTDSVLEIAEPRADFALSDDEFAVFLQYHLAICGKRELLGSSNHLLYICRKEN